MAPGLLVGAVATVICFSFFCKYYHILVEEFLLSDLPLSQKARAPGFVLVHGQILNLLDSTIHRQASVDSSGLPPITFDDVLAGADVSTAALPLPSANDTRLMAENRLIMLLRDFISERPSDYEEARQTFAESFSKMMHAAALKTSLFDHNACFVLCDFMEEALGLFVRFHHSNTATSDYIDWYFWLDVCKKMLLSQNTMSEIRLMSFIFGAWGTITLNEKRKKVLCIEWLASESVFEQLFNHWCPMVRAYYMRLLCWRLCRYDGEASQLDTKIYATISDRLKDVWAHYLYLRQTAEKERKMPPSIAPCLPAPGRRILIIRNDNQASAASIFLGFDGMVSSGSHGPAAKRSSVLAGRGRMEQNESKARAEPDTPNKKKWSLLGKIIPFSSPEAANDSSPTRGDVSPKFSRDTELDNVRKETATARARLVSHAKSSSSDSDLASPPLSHRAFSFKFSLEWNQQQPQVTVKRVRPFSPPRLPAPAQSHLVSQVPGSADEILARKPEGIALVGATYAGRALAEWNSIINECNNFVERRRAEGVPNLKFIEVPTLGVEGFRKFG